MEKRYKLVQAIMHIQLLPLEHDNGFFSHPQANSIVFLNFIPAFSSFSLTPSSQSTETYLNLLHHNNNNSNNNNNTDNLLPKNLVVCLIHHNPNSNFLVSFFVQTCKGSLLSFLVLLKIYLLLAQPPFLIIADLYL